MGEPIADWNGEAERLYEELVIVAEERDSVRAPGWYRASCHAYGRDGCTSWSTTGHAHVVDHAARAHVVDRHLHFVDPHLVHGGTRAGLVSFPSIRSERFADGPHASVDVCGLDGCVDSATSYVRTLLGLPEESTPVFRIDVAEVAPADPFEPPPKLAPAPYHDPSGRLGGYILAEPMRHEFAVVPGRIEANWDGEIHPTLELGRKAFADAMARGMADYELYAVVPVTAPYVDCGADGYGCPVCSCPVDVMEPHATSEDGGPALAWCAGSDWHDCDCVWSGPAADAVIPTGIVPLGDITPR